VATWELEVGDVMWEMARMVLEADLDDLQLQEKSLEKKVHKIIQIVLCE